MGKKGKFLGKDRWRRKGGKKKGGIRWMVAD